ncbi:phage capsid protein [Nocardioides phosphati]|uniref:Phage capsid protein n=1 Tax=Nocardioides phosphati TaxID=1867775 RepID=A0ABQ2N816_9ACTN|nr:phage major capsid protein [Nocardioides phosphati]GGO86631.1 phage capsid protein [Nocardioides phosphati]
MSDFIQRLREQRANTWEQAKALLDTAAAENRDLSAEEQSSYDRMNADLDSIAERVKSIEEQEQRNADMDAAFASIAEGRKAPAILAEPTQNELRKFLRGESRSFEVRPDGPVNFRDLTKGTATAGGNIVPTSFYNQLVQHMIEVSGILSAGPTVLQTSGGENFEVPTTTAHSSGALVAEAAAIAESDPAFAKRTLGAYKYGVLIQVARELIDDTGVDLEGYLSMQAGRAVGNAFGAHLATGTGSSQPSGIVTGSSLGVTGGTGVAGAFTADNLIDLFYSVIAPYRNSPSAGWIMRDATVAAVRKLKGSDNNYLWQPGLQAGVPDLLLGKPVHTDPNIAATGTTAKSVLFGDVSAYFVRLAGGVRFERSDEYAFNSDLVTFRCLVRGDGVLVDQTGAVKHFAGAAT